MKPALIFSYDPLCAWSFGFQPVIGRLAERFGDRLEIRVIPGGLALDDDAGPIGQAAPNLPETITKVKQTTGVQFGENVRLLFDEGSYRFDSRPACKAQTAINRLFPELSLQYASALQTAFFRDGQNLNQSETFLRLLNELKPDADPERFKKHLRSKENATVTEEQFEWCRSADAFAFPTLLLEIGSETGLMSKGYRPYDVLESHLHHLIRNIERLSS